MNRDNLIVEGRIGSITRSNIYANKNIANLSFEDTLTTINVYVPKECREGERFEVVRIREMRK